MTKIIKSIPEWLTLRKQISSSKTVGFVPTMGNLHIGHLSLLKRAAEENDVTILSIFVNPTQFNNSKDFEYYPRTLDQDIELTKSVRVDYILIPDAKEIYPDEYTYRISESKKSTLMEGQSRPGHFEGMLTIVMKLLMLARPTRAYFGEKDYQQFQLIRGLAEAFFLDIEIIPCETIREVSGLPYSSRNNRLTPEQRKKADSFPKIFHSNLSCEEIKKSLEEQGFGVDYITEYDGRRFAAIRIGDIRLIDNIEVSR